MSVPLLLNWINIIWPKEQTSKVWCPSAAPPPPTPPNKKTLTRQAGGAVPSHALSSAWFVIRVMNSPIACNRKCRGAAAWRRKEGARSVNGCLIPSHLHPDGRLSLDILSCIVSFTDGSISSESPRPRRPLGRNFCRLRLQLIGSFALCPALGRSTCGTVLPSLVLC